MNYVQETVKMPLTFEALFLSQVKPQINFLTCSLFFSLIVVYLQNTCYSYKILKLKESI